MYACLPNNSSFYSFTCTHGQFLLLSFSAPCISVDTPLIKTQKSSYLIKIKVLADVSAGAKWYDLSWGHRKKENPPSHSKVLHTVLNNSTFT